MKVISSIIVLMLENRSFDHLLGYSTLNVNKIASAPTTVPRDPNDFSKGSVSINPDALDVCNDDPPHDQTAIATQMNCDSTGICGMDGFIKATMSVSGERDESNPVSMFTPQTAPIINQLAEEFAVFDRYFCSAPLPTDPNRAYA